jgi:branched-subunit amino acid transport protein
MTAWLVVLGAGVGSYALRISMVAALGRREPPAWLTRVSTLVMPAAFAALAAPAVLVPSGAAAGDVVARALAVAVGAWVALRTDSPALSIAAGLPALWLASAALG